MKYGIVFVLVVPEVNPETKMLVLNLGDNTGHTSKEEGGCSRKGKKDNKGFFFFYQIHYFCGKMEHNSTGKF